MKNKGTTTSETGINILKVSSNVKEFDIQYKLVTKKPNPKDTPINNNFMCLLLKMVKNKNKIGYTKKLINTLL